LPWREAAREEVHGSGRQHRKRLVAAGEPRRRGRDRAVAAAGHDSIGLSRRGRVERGPDFRASDREHRRRVAGLFQHAGERSRQRIRIAAAQRAALHVQNDVKLHRDGCLRKGRFAAAGKYRPRPRPRRGRTFAGTFARAVTLKRGEGRIPASPREKPGRDASCK
jgi:hypothetical protein